MQDIEIKYYGNGDNLLLVLTGIGGTTSGYENKYVKLANKVIETKDFSVAVATTPLGSWQHTRENLEFIMNDVLRKFNHKIYAMGNSAGGNILLMHAHDFPQIERILAINPVLNINLFKIEKGINLFKDKITIICGENDMSNKFYKMIKTTAKIIVLKDIDHNFTNHLEDFIELPSRYLLAKVK